MTYRMILFLLATSLVMPLACNRQGGSEKGSEAPPGTTTISGVLLEGAGLEVVLEEMAAREFIPVDTVTCDENGRFLISFLPEKVAFYVLRAGPRGYVTLLIEPGESVVFNGIYGQPDQYQVKGSRGSELLRELALEHKKTLEALARVTRRNMELQSSPHYARLKVELDRQFDSITRVFKSYSLDFIHRNQESLSILIALYNLYGQGLPVFHPEQDIEVYRYVDSVLTLHYSGFEIVDLLHAQVVQASATEGFDKKSGSLEPGDFAPDFVSSGPDGRQLALSDLKGNYVLLSFWAGWSQPSREENRYLKKAWEIYGKRPFRILQVSLDSNKDLWLKTIDEDGLVWDHVSDLRRWETLLADLYRVEKIPANYLIDPEGRIIGKDLFGNELLDKLEQLFSNK
jgi:peroxiredoxin